MNITGDTKIMSQIVSTFFEEIKNTRIFYWPETNDRIQQLFPIIENLSLPKNTTLNLKEYFSSHGFTFEGKYEVENSFRKTHRNKSPHHTMAMACGKINFWYFD